HACTLIRTSPAPGCEISRSTISKSAPGLGTRTAFVGFAATFVVAIYPPINFQRMSPWMSVGGLARRYKSESHFDFPESLWKTQVCCGRVSGKANVGLGLPIGVPSNGEGERQAGALPRLKV